MNREEYEKASSLQEKIKDAANFIRKIENIKKEEIDYIGFKFKGTPIRLYPSLDVYLHIEDSESKNIDILKPLTVFLDLLKEKSEKELLDLEKEFNKL